MREELRRRARERERLIEALETYAESLSEELGRVSLILFGSYARGDFNLWSDIDVIVISEAFEGMEFVRRGLVIEDPFGRLSPICWTPEEFRSMVAKPSWRRALRGSVILRDEHGVTKLLRGMVSQ